MKKQFTVAIAAIGIMICCAYTNQINSQMASASQYKVTTADKVFTGRADISLFTAKADIGQADVGVD